MENSDALHSQTTCRSDAAKCNGHIVMVRLVLKLSFFHDGNKKNKKQVGYFSRRFLHILTVLLGWPYSCDLCAGFLFMMQAEFALYEVVLYTGAL